MMRGRGVCHVKWLIFPPWWPQKREGRCRGAGSGGPGVSRCRRDAAGMAGTGVGCAGDAQGWAEPLEQARTVGSLRTNNSFFPGTDKPGGARDQAQAGDRCLGWGRGRGPPAALCPPTSPSTHQGHGAAAKKSRHSIAPCSAPSSRGFMLALHEPTSTQDPSPALVLKSKQEQSWCSV